MSSIDYVASRLGTPAINLIPPRKPTFGIADDEMEVGVGIHGEPRRRTVRAGERQKDRHAHRESLILELLDVMAYRLLSVGRASGRRSLSVAA
jgi:hypothetical protein